MAPIINISSVWLGHLCSTCHNSGHTTHFENHWSSPCLCPFPRCFLICPCSRPCLCVSSGQSSKTLPMSLDYCTAVYPVFFVLDCYNKAHLYLHLHSLSSSYWTLKEGTVRLVVLSTSLRQSVNEHALIRPPSPHSWIIYKTLTSPNKTSWMKQAVLTAQPACGNNLGYSLLLSSAHFYSTWSRAVLCPHSFWNLLHIIDALGRGMWKSHRVARWVETLQDTLQDRKTF